MFSMMVMDFVEIWVLSKLDLILTREHNFQADDNYLHMCSDCVGVQRLSFTGDVTNKRFRGGAFYFMLSMNLK